MADRPFTDKLVNATARGLIGLALILPYRWRVPLVGWAVSHLIAPVAGWRKRVRANLAHVLPEMPADEVERLARAVPDNAGRTLIEIYSGDDFTRRVKNAPLTGPGVEAMDAAHAAGKPVIVVTGHFGNYDAPRAALIARGYDLGALYRPMSNEGFNAHYVKAISQIGEPVFPANKRGYAGLLKHVRNGGMAGFLIDIFSGPGAPVTFFGKTAPTALSAAELALKFNAPLVPVYGIRQSNGLDFEVVVEAPIPHSDPETMTQALNDSLEALVRQNMDQWFWIHRRWKPELQKALAAAKMGP